MPEEGWKNELGGQKSINQFSLFHEAYDNNYYYKNPVDQLIVGAQD